MALFITGHDRSGTTLLRKLCDQHPEMAVTNEFSSFYHIGLPYPAYRRQMQAGWIKPRNRYTFNKTLKYRSLRPLSNFLFNLNFLLRLRRSHSFSVSAGDIEAVMKKLYPQAKIVGDKYTKYMTCLPKLAQSDGLIGVIIYRDCRDVVNSFLREVRTTWKKETWTEKLDTAASVAERWVQFMGFMEQYDDQFYIMRYEKLVSDPGAELAALGKWLGVTANGFHFSNVHAGSIGKYREGLTEAELSTVMEIAGPPLARYGYI